MSSEPFTTELQQRAAARSRLLTRKAKVVALTGALGALLALGVIDFFSEASSGPRLFLSLIGLATVVGFFVRFRKTRMPHPVDELVSATEAEAGDGTLALRTSADDSARETTAKAEMGAELLERLDAHAAGILDNHPLPLRSGLRRWQVGLIGVLSLTLVFVALGGWFSFLRLALPGADLTYTKVSLAKPPERIAKGAMIEVPAVSSTHLTLPTIYSV